MTTRRPLRRTGKRSNTSRPDNVVYKHTKNQRGRGSRGAADNRSGENLPSPPRGRASAKGAFRHGGGLVADLDFLPRGHPARSLGPFLLETTALIATEGPVFAPDVAALKHTCKVGHRTQPHASGHALSDQKQLCWCPECHHIQKITYLQFACFLTRRLGGVTSQGPTDPQLSTSYQQPAKD
jgi:hypothetical protein